MLRNFVAIIDLVNRDSQKLPSNKRSGEKDNTMRNEKRERTVQKMTICDSSA